MILRPAPQPSLRDHIRNGFAVVGSIISKTKDWKPMSIEATEIQLRQELSQVTADLAIKGNERDEITTDVITASPDEKAFRERAAKIIEREYDELAAKQAKLERALNGIVFKKAQQAYEERCAYEEAQENGALETARALHDDAGPFDLSMEAYAVGYGQIEQKFQKLFQTLYSLPGLGGVHSMAPALLVPKILVARSLIDPTGNGFSRNVPPGAQSRDMDTRGVEPFAATTAAILENVEKAIAHNREKRAAENPRRFRKALSSDKPNGTIHR